MLVNKLVVLLYSHSSYYKFNCHSSWAQAYNYLFWEKVIIFLYKL